VKRTPLARRSRLNPIGKRSRLRDKEWKVNRLARLDFAGDRCEYERLHSGRCSRATNHVHHRGRSNDHRVEMLMAVCPEHHAQIHQHEATSYDLGYLVRRNR
jgi:hypothetical protein